MNEGGVVVAIVVVAWVRSSRVMFRKPPVPPVLVDGEEADARLAGEDR